jgi:hypothetical protein
MVAKPPGRNTRRIPSNRPARAGRTRRARSQPLRSGFVVVFDAIILPLLLVLIWSTKKCLICDTISLIRAGTRFGLLLMTKVYLLAIEATNDDTIIALKH